MKKKKESSEKKESKKHEKKESKEFKRGMAIAFSIDKKKVKKK